MYASGIVTKLMKVQNFTEISLKFQKFIKVGFKVLGSGISVVEVV